jgi:hypothetical protein
VKFFGVCKKFLTFFGKGVGRFISCRPTHRQSSKKQKAKTKRISNLKCQHIMQLED